MNCSYKSTCSLRSPFNIDDEDEQSCGASFPRSKLAHSFPTLIMRERSRIHHIKTKSYTSGGIDCRDKIKDWVRVDIAVATGVEGAWRQRGEFGQKSRESISYEINGFLHDCSGSCGPSEGTQRPAGLWPACAFIT